MKRSCISHEVAAVLLLICTVIGAWRLWNWRQDYQGGRYQFALTSQVSAIYSPDMK